MTTHSKKILKAFVASASDCEDLRKATKNVIDEVNETLNLRGVEIDVYTWEDKKRAGFLKKGLRYQDEIFKEFGEHCDIFIIFFWTKLGEGTKEEYEHFKSVFLAKNPNILFLGCHYNKKMSHLDLKKHNTYYDLMSFLTDNTDDWMPLGRERTIIAKPESFSKELRVELMKYIQSNNFFI